MTKNIKQKNNYLLTDELLSVDNIKRQIQIETHPAYLGDSVRAASVFLLFSEREELYTTVILKADNKGYPWANQIALPGGHIDPKDENAVAAAYRELQEELRISKSHVELIGSMGHFLTINNTQIEVFTGLWDEEETIRFDEREIAKVFSVPLRSFIETHLEKNFSGRVPGWDELMYPVEDAVMWGATAKIFHYLIELICRPVDY